MKLSMFFVATMAAGLATAAQLSSTALATTIPGPVCMRSVLYGCREKCLDLPEDTGCENRCWDQDLTRCDRRLREASDDGDVVDLQAAVPTSLPVPDNKTAETETSTKPLCNAPAVTRCCTHAFDRDGDRLVVNETRWNACFDKHFCPREKPDEEDENQTSSMPIVEAPAPAPAPAPSPDATISSEQSPESDTIEMGKKCNLQAILDCVKGCEHNDPDKCQLQCRKKVCKRCHGLCDHKGEVIFRGS